MNKETPPPNSSALSTSRKILIIGGGIAGVTLANFLEDSQYDVALIERARQWRTIGFGVGIWLNGLKILRKLNLEDSFWSKTMPVSKGAVMDLAGTMLYQLPVSKLGVPEMARTVERDVLLTHLAEKLTDKTRVRLGVDFKDLKQVGEKVEVIFTDGSTELFDLVVGADGLRSTVRQKVFGNFIKPYGWTVQVYWAGKTRRFYDDYCVGADNGKLFLRIRCGDRYALGFGYANGEPNQCRDKNPEQFLEELKEASPDLKDLVESIDHTKAMFKDRLQYVAMKGWYRGNVVLIGDAKHARSPLSGFGTSLALEDAYTLAEILKKNMAIPDSLERFSRDRNQGMKKINTFARVMEAGLLTRIRPVRLLLRLIPQSLAVYLLKRALVVR